MEDLKKIILEIFEGSTIAEASSTGTTGENIIYAPFNEIIDDIIKEVSDNYERKKCMPEGINSKEEHEQYLKDIGYNKYVKDLEHHKDTTVGLFAFDKEIEDIFENIPDKDGCKTSVEACMVQQIEYLKSIVFRVS